MAYVCYFGPETERPGFIASSGELDVTDETFPARAASLGWCYAEVPVADVLGIEQQTRYFHGGAVVPRPTLPIYMSRTEIKADGKRLATITGLPKPTTVAIDGQPHVIEDGRLDLISDMPAQYQLAIDQWPYLPWSATVTAK